MHCTLSVTQSVEVQNRHECDWCVLMLVLGIVWNNSAGLVHNSGLYVPKRIQIHLLCTAVCQTVQYIHTTHHWVAVHAFQTPSLFWLYVLLLWNTLKQLCAAYH